MILMLFNWKFNLIESQRDYILENKTNRSYMKKKIEKFKQSNLYQKLAEHTILGTDWNRSYDKVRWVREQESIPSDNNNLGTSFLLNFINQ